MCGGEGIWKHVWLAGLCKSKASGQCLGWQLLSGLYTRRQGACQYLCQASLSEGKGEARITFPLLVGPGGSIGSPRILGWDWLFMATVHRGWIEHAPKFWDHDKSEADPGQMRA